MEGQTDTRENARATISGEMQQDKTWFQSMTGEIGEKFTAFRQGATDLAQTAAVWLACSAGTVATIGGSAFGSAYLAYSAGAPAGTATDAAAVAGAAAGMVASLYGTYKASQANNENIRERQIDQGRLDTGSWVVQDRETGEVFQETLHENGKITSEPADADIRVKNGVPEDAVSLENEGGSAPAPA